mgnify:FL=1
MVILGAPSDYNLIVANYVKLLSLNKRMSRLLESEFSVKFNKEINQFSMANFAKEIQTTGLIVHDRDDDIVAFSEGQKIAATWKNANFMETYGLKHSLHSDEVYLKMINFLIS